jgi:predicted TIM-barrel enzyme
VTANRIVDVFGTPRVLLPVIHPVSREAALASAAIACDAGVRGVWLINQGMGDADVLRLVTEVRDRFALWVGINLLGHSPAEALAAALDACGNRIDGIWSDNAAIDERATEQRTATEFLAARRTHGWSGLYFGGVAFKYQREVAATDLGHASAAAAAFMDVICTSGPGTGQAANVDKVVAMRRGVGDGAAIALASGVTADNVGAYLPYVDAYLVGTGIESGFGVLDATKTNALANVIAAFVP